MSTKKDDYQLKTSSVGPVVAPDDENDIEEESVEGVGRGFKAFCVIFLILVYAFMIDKSRETIAHHIQQARSKITQIVDEYWTYEILVDSQPQGAKIYAGDQEMGTTPKELLAKKGRYGIKVTLPGYQKAAKNVVVNGDVRVLFRLKREKKQVPAARKDRPPCANCAQPRKTERAVPKPLPVSRPAPVQPLPPRKIAPDRAPVPTKSSVVRAKVKDKPPVVRAKRVPIRRRIIPKRPGQY